MGKGSRRVRISLQGLRALKPFLAHPDVTHRRSSPAQDARNVPPWIESTSARLIQCAAHASPCELSERLEEEWLAAMSERSGKWGPLIFALGCCWAATKISRDDWTVLTPATSSARGDMTMTAIAYGPSAIFLRHKAAVSAQQRDLCEINTTPLIDVMLVLLVTLIISLPIMTHG
jgi:hypothetical protein